MFQQFNPAIGGSQVRILKWVPHCRMKLTSTGPTRIPYVEGAGMGRTLPSRVLVTDDDDKIRELVRLILERRGGLKVVDTGDSGEAIRICLTQPISLVISDILKPYMSGLTILEALRSNQTTQHIPFMFLTASGLDRHVTAFELGANDYMTKPFLPQEFLSRVWRLLAWQN